MSRLANTGDKDEDEKRARMRRAMFFRFMPNNISLYSELEENLTVNYEFENQMPLGGLYGQCETKRVKMKRYRKPSHHKKAIRITEPFYRERLRRRSLERELDEVRESRREDMRRASTKIARANIDAKYDAVIDPIVAEIDELNKIVKRGTALDKMIEELDKEFG